jgi:membrane protease YdiL (CAAX protease family)
MIMEQQNTRKRGMPWRLYFVLLFLAAVGALGLLPSAPSMFAGVQQSSGMPLPLFMVATFLQTFLLTSVLGFLGLLLSRKTGLGAPVLEPLVYRNPVAVTNTATAAPSSPESGLGGTLAFSAIVGLVAGAVIFGVDLLFLRWITVELAGAASAPRWWQGLLSSLYGGINEEIMMRLFFLNGLLWLLTLFGRRKTAPWRVWIAVLMASLIFGLGHLPAARAMVVMDPPMVVRILVLNLIPGIVFGVLFWKGGLLSAMTAHFSADVLMHAVAPLLFPSLAGG